MAVPRSSHTPHRQLRGQLVLTGCGLGCGVRWMVEMPLWGGWGVARPQERAVVPRGCGMCSLREREQHTHTHTHYNFAR